MYVDSVHQLLTRTVVAMYVCCVVCVVGIRQWNAGSCLLLVVGSTVPVQYGIVVVMFMCLFFVSFFTWRL